METISQIPLPGSTGPHVSALQRMLKTMLFDAGPIDGVFGKRTQKAVSDFQKSIGLAGTGTPGPKTIQALGLVVDGTVPAGKPVTTGMDPDEGQPDWYRRMWNELKFDPGFEDSIASDAKKVLVNKDRYAKVARQVFVGCYFEDESGVRTPVDGFDLWFIVGLIHMKEASCNFLGCLANGEKIIGTGKKTTIVPKGRGPYSTWEESAIDALTMESLGKIKDVNIGPLLYAVERFNGTGYITGAGKAETSPYVWARSNINDGKGKYPSDGKFDPDADTNKTSGFATMLKWLVNNGHIIRTMSEGPSPIPLTRELVAQKIVEVITRDIAAKLRETGGKNRSPRIDAFNKRAHVPMGSPYCASGGTCAVADAVAELSEELGRPLKNPVKITASSQDPRRENFVPAKYIRKEGSKGKKGDVGVLQVNGDPSHGHYTTLSKDQELQPSFDTVEYNTDSEGGRDGDGAYARVRSTIDGAKANAGKLFICFTDFPQWIVDVNS